MKFERTFVCFSCHELFENAPNGRCLACGSTNVYPLSWYGRPEEERRSWFDRVSGTSRRPVVEEA